MSGSDTPHISLKLSSNPLYLSGARELVSSVARRLGFAEAQCSQIALAVDEALCNVIRHGYDRRADGPIWINIWPLDSAGHEVGCCKLPGATPETSLDSEPTGIRIVIEDEAKQVDPGVIKSRNLEEIRPGGLGVHIIKEVMDHVRYEHRQPRGMRLTMIKHKTGVDSGAHSAAAPGGVSAQAKADRP